MSEKQLKEIKDSIDFQERITKECDFDMTFLQEEIDLYDEVVRLSHENKELKKKLYSPDQVDFTCPKCGEKCLINYSREVYDLKNILTEFENWLEEQNVTALNENFAVIRLADVKKKLQELKVSKVIRNDTKF